MAERKLKNPSTGETIHAETVDIEEITEKPIIIKLADGTVLRIRVDVVEVVRFKDQWDQDGHPVYNMKSGTLLAVLDSPEHLQKRM